MLSIKPFISAYDDYEKLIAEIPKDAYILEVGAGAFPSVIGYENYYCLDPDKSELDKVNLSNKIYTTLEAYETNLKFDFIISQMVLEHVEKPIQFHSKVLDLLKPSGKAIHFFACGRSLPSIINSAIPESVSDFLLRRTKSRDIDNEPKYKAYYLMTDIFKSSVVNKFIDIGFVIRNHTVYIGHNYLHAVPILKTFEHLFSKISFKFKWKSTASVGLLILEKDIKT